MLDIARAGRRAEVQNVDQTMFRYVLAGGAYRNRLAFNNWRHRVWADMLVTSVRADLHTTSFNITTAAPIKLQDKCKYAEEDVLFNANRIVEE